MVFDGREFARKIEEKLPRRKAKLVVLLDPGNPASVAYTNLKAKMAKRLGIEFEILNFKFEINELKSKILNLNLDESVDGIMIQLPLANSDELIKLIDPKKDVDGLKKDGPLKPAVVRAVQEILNHEVGIMNYVGTLVVGSRGTVGKKMLRHLPGASGMDKEDFEPDKLRKADVIISCTGQEGLINGSMVKNGFVAIDVGYPKAEFTADALAKASFYTPVPGGVGPVTVACLFENLVEGAQLA